MSSYLFGQRSKVCGPSKVNIFNQLVKRLTCFQLGNVDGLNQILVLKYIFLYHSMTMTFFWDHIVSARYYCNTCFNIITFSYKQKKIHICELIYTIRLLFYE